MPAFRPFPDRPAAELGYHEVPIDVQERPERLLEWARRALAAASRRDARQAGERKGRARRRR
jgi:hypothetical protein